MNRLGFVEAENQGNYCEVNNNARKDLKISLVSGNVNKFQMFKASGVKAEIFQVSPEFDEDTLKKSLLTDDSLGIEHALNISHAKLREHRNSVFNKESKNKELTVRDEIFLTSDSVLLVPTANGYRVLSRGASTEEKSEALKFINSQKKVIFSGTISFGRKLGRSIYSISTLVEFPLTADLNSLPVNIDKMKEIIDYSKGIEVSYVQNPFRSDESVNCLSRKVFNFDEARPYISGLTPDAISLAREVVVAENLFSPILEEILSDYSYNTFSFYNQTDGSKDSYESIIKSNNAFFKDFGGNCTLFSLELATRIYQQFGIIAEVVTYPSRLQEGSRHKEGHSALLITWNNIKYLLDVGLGVSYPLPLASIPVIPCGINDKIFFGNSSAQTPNIEIKRPIEVIKLEAQRVMSLDDFLTQAPLILSELHNLRNEYKFAIQNIDGSNIAAWKYSIKNELLSFRFGNFIFKGTIKDYFSDHTVIDSINELKNKFEPQLKIINNELKRLKYDKK